MTPDFRGTSWGVIARTAHLAELRRLLRSFPVVGVIGPRQVGKSTLARALRGKDKGTENYFDLEDPRALARLENPMLSLEPLRGLVVLDEIQRRPELFPVLRVLADRPRSPARFLVLGSASPELLRQGSESLAGRIAYHELGGFNLSEVKQVNLRKLWVRGGFPRAYAARSESESLRWRREFTRTFAERELAALEIGIAPTALSRFWTMLSHYHGQIWNGAELARAFGVSEKTVRHYLDVLTATFMTLRLQPWFENAGKREVKAPKVYLRDTGLLHYQLGIESYDDLLGHPKSGASWEGFAVGEIIQTLRADPRHCFFWALHSGAELDLLIVRGKRRLGFEIKLTDAPRVTPSMRSALDTLKLERLYVVHSGRDAFPLAERIEALPLARVARTFGSRAAIRDDE
jgi:predicted AAA+ superfamily ATPase